MQPLTQAPIRCRKGVPDPPSPARGCTSGEAPPRTRGCFRSGAGAGAHTRALPAAGSAQGRAKGCAVRPPVGLFPARAECEASFQTVERCLQISTKLVFTFLQLDTMEQNRCCLFPFSCIYMEMCFHSEDALRGFFGSLHQLLPTTMSHQAWPQGEKKLLVSLLPATPDFSILLDPSLAIAFLVILNALFELFGAELLSRMQIIR
ncbi:uncharacterized protein PRD47_019316 isoform 1-T1 [Ara ararauna]